MGTLTLAVFVVGVCSSALSLRDMSFVSFRVSSGVTFDLRTFGVVVWRAGVVMIELDWKFLRC